VERGRRNPSSQLPFSTAQGSFGAQFADGIIHKPKQGCSSVGRAAVSKTVGREFESCRPCHSHF
jgi:hypothetical protein